MSTQQAGLLLQPRLPTPAGSGPPWPARDLGTSLIPAGPCTSAGTALTRSGWRSGGGVRPCPLPSRSLSLRTAHPSPSLQSLAAVSQPEPTSPTPQPQEGEAPAHLCLDRQVEGTFLERQQVPIVIARALGVDPHFQLQGRREAGVGLRAAAPVLLRTPLLGGDHRRPLTTGRPCPHFSVPFADRHG